MRVEIVPGWSGAISCMEVKSMSQSVKYVGLDVHKVKI
jgi:hypothetical protein